MEKKLAVIVDNKEVTTEIVDAEMCSSACDVAMETCSSENHDAYRSSCSFAVILIVKSLSSQSSIHLTKGDLEYGCCRNSRPMRNCYRNRKESEKCLQKMEKRNGS